MEVTRTQIRIPKDISDWIKLEAKRDNRSMNAKLVQILSEARDEKLKASVANNGVISE